VTFSEYQKELELIAYEKNSTEERILIHLMSEVGEVADLYYKYRPGIMRNQLMVMELGDVLGCLTNLINAAGFDLDDIAMHNCKKLWKRREMNP
jgi:NTP pyrophosphatase (non-canonical NTP hydrolase)